MNAARRAWFAGAILMATMTSVRGQSDPLPSWNEGTAKRAITEFVRRVTQDGSPDFVPAAERVATFDNDGTMWAEQPMYFQAAFAVDRIKALAPQYLEWKNTQPFKGVLEGDARAVAATGHKGIGQILAATHAGMTTEEFARIVTDWHMSARHPRFNRPYAELIYQPMLELMAYLRAHGFKTFIVSGGGIEFMRPWMEKVYGVPPEQIVGSSGVTTLATGPDGKPVLIKEAKLEFIDDGPGKPAGINRFIGRRPIAAFGNSDGDLQMLQWTMAGPGARLAVYVHHDDAEREYAYDRDSHMGKLDKGLDEAKAKGWPVVSMRNDWKVIFPEPR
jgi:phosphoglycolate phosphatase-like HAD superfamily hydrolase